LFLTCIIFRHLRFFAFLEASLFGVIASLAFVLEILSTSIRSCCRFKRTFLVQALFWVHHRFCTKKESFFGYFDTTTSAVIGAGDAAAFPSKTFWGKIEAKFGKSN